MSGGPGIAWIGAGILLGVTCSFAAVASPVTALAFSPDGKQLLIGRTAAVEVRNLEGLKLKRTMNQPFPKVGGLVFSPKGDELVVAGGVPGVEGGVQRFDWPSGKPLPSLTNHSDVANAAVFSPDGSMVLTVGSDGVGQLLERPDGKLTRTLAGHAGPVLGGAFSPDGKWMVTASADRSVKVWDAISGKLERSFSHHTEIVHCIAFRPASARSADESRGAAAAPGIAQCATGSDDRTVRIWQPGIGRMVRIIRGHDGPVFALAYHPEGARLFSAGKEGVIRTLDADSDQILHQWQAHGDWIYALAMSPDGRRLASGDWAGKVRLWDLKAGQPSLAGETE